MDSCAWAILNVIQNLLKTKQNTQKTFGTLITRRGVYTYIIGNNYHLLNFIIENSLSIHPLLPCTLQMTHKDPFFSHLYLPTFPNLSFPHCSDQQKYWYPKPPKNENTTYNNPQPLPIHRNQPSHPSPTP